MDRGGLLPINDKAFESFCAIELGIQRHLNVANVNDMDDTFHSRLINDLVDDSDVQFCMCLVGEMDEESGINSLSLFPIQTLTI